jgi:hypothetical protein
MNIELLAPSHQQQLVEDNSVGHGSGSLSGSELVVDAPSQDVAALIEKSPGFTVYSVGTEIKFILELGFRFCISPVGAHNSITY